LHPELQRGQQQPQRSAGQGPDKGKKKRGRDPVAGPLPRWSVHAMEKTGEEIAYRYPDFGDYCSLVIENIRNKDRPGKRENWIAVFRQSR
jgi:hypothetical protein